MEKMFKRSVLGVAILGAVAGVSIVTAPVASAEGFFEDSSIGGAVNIWHRNRDRGNTVNGEDTRMETNVNSTSLYAGLGFNSGYVSDIVGFDFNIYATADLQNNGSPDHEMNFWDVDNPYDKTPASNSCDGTWSSACTTDGVAVQTAAAKFKMGDVATAKLGYFQPSVPSALGVNWSFAAGTYTGGEIGANFGDLQVGAVVADSYRAPWFQSSYEFRTSEGKDAGSAYSVGARYTLSNGLLFDTAYAGLTDGDRKNFHLKLKYTTDSGLYLSPQLYVVKDDEQYKDTAAQLAFLASKSFGVYSVRAEATMTAADSGDAASVGNMAYRLTQTYGGSNGAYDIWWNNRSDFNHDGELAVFASVARDFSDIGAQGFNAGVSGAYGTGAKAEGYKELKEGAISAFANYAIQDGALKGANVGFYYTRYENDTDAPNWTGYTNSFQDEEDFKLTLTMPFSVK
ncbi:multidrug transporter [Enterovibrio sp. 27052020O]|uniref:multidrug transporter n=1 Tax=Enterovibrio sp. 27052020O TaxID=3241166 RepID=UPI00388D573E